MVAFDSTALHSKWHVVGEIHVYHVLCVPPREITAKSNNYVFCFVYLFRIARFPKIGVPLNHPFIDGFPSINHPFLGTTFNLWKSLYSYSITWLGSGVEPRA